MKAVFQIQWEQQISDSPLNFKQTNLSHEEIKELLLKKSKLALNDGVSFGNNGNKYFRLNAALSKKALEIALNQLSVSFK